MGETIAIPTTDQQRLTLIRCEDKSRHFCLHDAYRAYDRIASEDEVVTRQQFDAVNDAMKARTPLSAWKDFLAPRSIPHLDQVPKRLDLIDASESEYVHARERVRQVYRALTGRFYITDMAASKVCYLKRPSLIAISDSYVRATLLGPDEEVRPDDPRRGEEYARRGVAVMDAIRRVGRLNAEPLQSLSDYARTLQVDGKPVIVSKNRILDILIWGEVAINKRHPFWKNWADENMNRVTSSVTNPKSVTEAGVDLPCPKCGGKTIRRDGPKGSFYGCLQYPECNGTRSIYQCPSCGGDTTRRDRPKGSFYGCLRYPECRGTVSLADAHQRFAASSQSSTPGPSLPSSPKSSGWLSWLRKLFRG
ncbi:MAG: DUF6308 family protein [Isosphaerales bacterium]